MEREQDDRIDVAVLGAGLAGLAAALTAARAGATVRLLDAHPLGGRARTTTVDPGVVFNSGPRALYLGGAAERVLNDLGVEVRGHHPATSGVQVVIAGKVHSMPAGAMSLMGTGALRSGSKSRFGVLLAGVQRIDPVALAGLSVEDWLDSTRLRPDARDLVRAVIRLATYTARTDLLGADAALAQLQQAVGPGVLYLDGGWQQLVDSLERTARTEGVVIDSGSAARVVTRDPSGDGWAVTTSTGDLRARAVVMAMGTPAAAERVSAQPLHLGELGEPVTAACWELALRRCPQRPHPHPQRPRPQRQRPRRLRSRRRRVNMLLGVDEPLYLSRHSPPARLAPEGIEVMHVARYGARDARRDRADLAAHARLAGVDPGDIVAERFLARMVVSAAMPLAERGGLAGRPAVEVPGAEGLFLAGDWVGAEGMLADAALASGRLAGAQAAQLARVAGKCDSSADASVAAGRAGRER